MFDLRIVNATLVTPDEVAPRDIGIRDGLIAAISLPGGILEAKETIDARGKTVLPGAVDIHCHSVDPGPSDVTGFDRCSMAAAAGGVTTIVDMPFQLPATFNRETLQVKLDSITPKAYVDFALWGTALSYDLTTIAELAETGIVGYKFFMQSSVSFLPHLDDGRLLHALEQVKETGLPVGVHAENNDMIAYLEEKLKSEGRTDGMAFVESHPPITELEAINRALFLAGRIGLPLHIFHCTLADGIEMVSAARATGKSVSAETCPHYLILDENELARQKGFAKIAPPLRTSANIERMWSNLAAGEIDIVASDHCPYEIEQKNIADIWEVPAGAPGIQTLMPLMLSHGVKRDRISLLRLAQSLSENPARLCGLFPKKGACRVGSDADLVIIDLTNEKTLDVADLVETAWTPFAGLPACLPERTLVRGQTIYQDSRIVGRRGYGKFVKRR